MSSGLLSLSALEVKPVNLEETIRIILLRKISRKLSKNVTEVKALELILQDFRDAETPAWWRWPASLSQKGWYLHLAIVDGIFLSSSEERTQEESDLWRASWQQVKTRVSYAGCEDTHNYWRTRLTNILQSASAQEKSACLCSKWYPRFTWKWAQLV